MSVSPTVTGRSEGLNGDCQPGSRASEAVESCSIDRIEPSGAPDTVWLEYAHVQCIQRQQRHTCNSYKNGISMGYPKYTTLPKPHRRCLSVKQNLLTESTACSLHAWCNLRLYWAKHLTDQQWPHECWKHVQRFDHHVEQFVEQFDHLMVDCCWDSFVQTIIIKTDQIEFRLLESLNHSSEHFHCSTTRYPRVRPRLTGSYTHIQLIVHRFLLHTVASEC